MTRKKTEPLRSLADIKPLEAPEGSSALSLERWTILVDTFRGQRPVNYAAAAKAAKTTVATARNAFEKGAASLNRPAIREILLLEAREARTQVEKKFETLRGNPEDRLHANNDAVNARADEAVLIRGAGVMAGTLQKLSATLLKGVRPLAERAAAEMQSLATSKADLKAMMAVFKDVLALVKGTSDLVAAKMEMERHHLGDPDAIAATTIDVTAAEAIEEIRSAERLLERLKRESTDSAIAQELEKQGVNLKLIVGG